LELSVGEPVSLALRSNDQDLWMALGGVTRGAYLPEDDLKSVVLIRTGVGALVREGTPVLTVVDDGSLCSDDVAVGDSRSLLDELVREGARQMLAAALQAEVAAYVEAHADALDAEGHRLVVCNGYHQPRKSPRRRGGAGTGPAGQR
jgi:hypothetical protein